MCRRSSIISIWSQSSSKHNTATFLQPSTSWQRLLSISTRCCSQDVLCHVMPCTWSHVVMKSKHTQSGLLARRRQGLQQETTEPGSTGSSSEVASSSRQHGSSALTDSAVTSTLDMILLQAALQISDSSSPGESPFSTASQTVQMPDEEEERIRK